MICQQCLNVYTASFLPKRSISRIYKTELVEEIAAQAEILKATAAKALKAMIDTVIATVAKGDISQPDNIDYNLAMAYSLDFRRKVLSVRKKEGLTIAEVAARFDD
ncbi:MULTISPECIES: HU family DNA-binding protein [Nitrosomonas]|uniref:Uncharacterized protein n=1 Tax=Nitrosomonas communis TaxID=44574 RepID=A0A5D3Y859_9PROT|nr:MULTISPECIES: hypothetical protein [Nitrosomonas]TYP78323.1 hypothetical protein BCL69_10763 [Nitrosomonas communis]UVS60294.1 hypothetical protein NX761_12320 [Nitrosomonas sp. PLL12]